MVAVSLISSPLGVNTLGAMAKEPNRLPLLMSGLNTVIPEAVGRSPSPKKSALPAEMRWMLPVCDESTACPRNKVLYSSTRPRNLIFSSI